MSRSFWLRFNAKHSSLTIKRQGKVSINRALNCNREMACEHLGNFVLLYCSLLFSQTHQRKCYFLELGGILDPVSMKVTHSVLTTDTINSHNDYLFTVHTVLLINEYLQNVEAKVTFRNF